MPGVNGDDRDPDADKAGGAEDGEGEADGVLVSVRFFVCRGRGAPVPW